MTRMTDEDLAKMQGDENIKDNESKDPAPTIEVFGYGLNSLIVAGFLIVGVYYVYSKGMFKKIKI